jgi:acyl-CoA thioesterase FadM
MGRPISGEYRVARRILSGSTDPSGLGLNFELDGSRVFTIIDPKRSPLGEASVVSAGRMQDIADDVSHATLAALRKRVGVTRESRLRFLKPLYTRDAIRAEGHMLRDTGGLYAINIRVIDGEERLCLEGEVEIFALAAEQVRRMTPDGMLPVELRRFFSS